MKNYVSKSIMVAAATAMLTTACTKQQEVLTKTNTATRHTRVAGTKFYCIDNGSATPLIGANGISFLEGNTNGQGLDPTINYVIGSAGDAIIRDAGGNPLIVMGISTDPATPGIAYALVSDINATTHSLYEFSTSDPSNATQVAGTSSISWSGWLTDLELDYNNPTGAPRWLALDRYNSMIHELDFAAGTITKSHSYKGYKIPGNVTGMGWFNKDPQNSKGAYIVLHSVSTSTNWAGQYDAYYTLLDNSFGFQSSAPTQTSHVAQFDESGVFCDNPSIQNSGNYGSAIVTGTSTYDFAEDIDPSTTTPPIPVANQIVSQTGNPFEIWDFAVNW
jgi:hypothetical protein